MKSLRVLGAAALLVGCVNYPESGQTFCNTVTPGTRARVCEDGPTVVSLEPAQQAKDVSPRTLVTVTFNQGVSCPDAGITLQVNQVDGGVVRGGIVCSNTKAVFTPAESLLAGISYRAAVTEDVVNDAGTPVLPSSWVFQVVR